MPARLLRVATDERLVELVRSGSEPAFEAVFDRHHRGILAFCRHMLGSADEAEDAVQQVFLSAYRALLAGDGREIHLRAWLYTIARNRCLSVLRARRERPLDEAPEPSTEHLADEVQRREDLRAMLRDVAELPDEQRAALVLAEVGDVSHAEIAEVLGVKREKVKALVFQARTSLTASRVAREVSCADVREQLAELRGGALRRTSLRRHLRDCAGCREFRTALVAQRRALAVLLPVVPTAGLKAAVLGSAFGGGAAAAGGAATGAGAGTGAAGGSAVAGASGGGAALTGAASSVGSAGLVAKALVVVAVAGSGAAVGTRELRESHAPAPAPPGHAAPQAAHHARHATSAAGAAGVSRTTGDAPGAGRRASGTAKHTSGASDVAHRTGHRARGHHAAGADGNHGLGDGSGGGRTQAPGRLAKANGGGGASAHGNGRGGATHGGGASIAPGRTKAPGTSAGGGNGSAHPTAPATGGGTLKSTPSAGGGTTHGSGSGTTAPAASAEGRALGVAKNVPAPTAVAAPPAAPPAGTKAHGGTKAG